MKSWFERISVRKGQVSSRIVLCLGLTISGDEFADFSRNGVVAVSFRVADITAVDVNARCWFSRNFVDSVDATVA